MKKLFCILFATLSIAQADTLATAPNNAGGLLVLTDVPCEGTKKYHAYTSHPSSETQFGCWFSDSSMVHITWRNGSVRSYELDGWEINLEVLRKMRSKPKGTTL